jgi:proline iminopeptidase
MFAKLLNEQNKTMARIENHYFCHKGFFQSDNWILENIHRIQHIEEDRICPWTNAAELHASLPSSNFILVPNAGHSGEDPGILEALIEATDRFKPTFEGKHPRFPM